MTEGRNRSVSLLANFEKKQNLSANLQSVDFQSTKSMNQVIGQLSDEEKEADFNRQHEEYVSMKMERKKEMLKIKKEEFGSSSDSDENLTESYSDLNNSDDERVVSLAEKLQSKTRQEKGQCEQEVDPEHQQNFKSQQYEALLELKTSMTSTHINFFQDYFTINSKTLRYQNIDKVILKPKESVQAKTYQKITIHMFNGEELNLYVLEKSSQEKLQSGAAEKLQSGTAEKLQSGVAEKLQSGVFEKLIEMRIEKSGMWGEMEGKGLKNEEDYSQALLGVSWISGKIYKKSQIIGNWEERFILLNPEGIYSYKKPNSKHTMFISRPTIKQIITKFDLHNHHLVLRLIYQADKTDFAIPFSNPNWLTFFQLLLTFEAKE